VDARNVRNIVLFRPVNNMIEFKQIIGRGTRLFDDKYYFTIYDFVGANKNFQDAEWDGDPFCPVCGNYPCSCSKCIPYGDIGDVQQSVSVEPQSERIKSEVCPVCGHLPCTCEGGQSQKTVKVRLSAKRELELKTTWTEKFQYGEDLISLEEFIKILFGRLPYFFTDSLDLHKQWEHPDTRLALLDQLEREGFAEDKLRMVQRVIGREDCDLLDVLEFLAYATTPIDRVCRVELVRQDYYKKQSDKSQEFLDFLMEQYVRNGEREFTMTNLPKFLEMKYGSTSDAIKQLSMNPAQIKNQYLNFQKNLYIA
jgi:type I restriction enzyme R subunit